MIRIFGHKTLENGDYLITCDDVTPYGYYNINRNKVIFRSEYYDGVKLKIRIPEYITKKHALYEFMINEFCK